MQCEFNKPDGTQCEAHAIKDSGFCYFHNPDISDEEKREAQTRGGQARGVTLAEPLPVMNIKKIPDITLFLVDTISRVRAGKMDVRTANCLGFLSDKLMRALELSDLEERFNKLEQLVNEKTNNK